MTYQGAQIAYHIYQKRRSQLQGNTHDLTLWLTESIITSFDVPSHCLTNLRCRSASPSITWQLPKTYPYSRNSKRTERECLFGLRCCSKHSWERDRRSRQSKCGIIMFHYQTPFQSKRTMAPRDMQKSPVRFRTCLTDPVLWFDMMEKVEKIKTKLVFISRQTSNNRCDCSTYPVRKGQPVFINDDLTLPWNSCGTSPGWHFQLGWCPRICTAKC